MAHLLDYEEAQGDHAKALMAIEVSKKKNAKYLAWHWAEQALNHAKSIGVEASLGRGRYPDTQELERLLELNGE